LRILLDQNLSPRLIRKLADLLPGLESVYTHGLMGASDPFIFDWARKAGFSALLSADRDFVRIADEQGPPPKVIQIERCDFPSDTIEQLIRREILRIHDFLLSERATLLLRI
jgi:predicted nuclease of predicted toxin-antitoxin system